MQILNKRMDDASATTATLVVTENAIATSLREGCEWGLVHFPLDSSESFAITDRPIPMTDPSPETVFRHCNGLLASICGHVVDIYSDPFGCLPLFYARKGNAVHIADSPQSLLSIASGDLDDTGLLEFFFSEACLEGRTIWKGISRLQPGFRLSIDSRTGTTSASPWHRLGHNGADVLHTEDAMESIDARFRAIFQAVAKKNREIWLPLSGGPDSRLALMYAHQECADQLHTFTFAHSQKTLEYQCARDACVTLGLPPPIFIQLDRSCYTLDWHELVFRSGGMLSGSNAHTLHALRMLPSSPVHLISNMNSDAVCGWAVESHISQDRASRLPLQDVVNRAHKSHWISAESYAAISQDLTRTIGRWHEESCLTSASEYFYVKIRHAYFQNFLNHTLKQLVPITAPFLDPELCRLWYSLPLTSKKDKFATFELIRRHGGKLALAPYFSSLLIDGRERSIRRIIMRANNLVRNVLMWCSRDTLSYPNIFGTEDFGIVLRRYRHDTLLQSQNSDLASRLFSRDFLRMMGRHYYRSTNHGLQSAMVNLCVIHAMTPDLLADRSQVPGRGLL